MKTAFFDLLEGSWSYQMIDSRFNIFIASTVRLIIWKIPLLSLYSTFKTLYKTNVNQYNHDKYQAQHWCAWNEAI